MAYAIALFGKHEEELYDRSPKSEDPRNEIKKNQRSMQRM